MTYAHTMHMHAGDNLLVTSANKLLIPQYKIKGLQLL